MLATQVQYWTLQESKRHNLAQDILGYMSLEENKRHNITTETETQRHNIGQENYWSSTISETRRHNIAQEEYWTNSLSETARHNMSMEALQAESNSIGWENVNLGYYRAKTDRYMADIQAANAETNRLKYLADFNIQQQQMDINRTNASTERMKTQFNYSLGLESNRISQENADTNRMNSNIQFLQYGTGSRQASSATRTSEANYQNSLSNIQKNLIEQTRIGLGYDNLEFEQSKFDWQKRKDVADTYLKAVNTAGDFMSNILKFISH